MARKFLVTKTFTAGTLKGLVITETTAVPFVVGDTGGGGWTGAPYIVTAVAVAA